MRRVVVGLLFTMWAVCWTAAQEVTPTGAIEPEAASNRLTFVGSYLPDGRYMEGEKAGRLPSETALPWQLLHDARPKEVPPSIDLQPYERVVEDRDHKQRTFQRRSSLVTAFERLMVFAYGHELALLSPSHLTTDSRRRLIVCDPRIPAVHVLDGENSFRIEGGDGRRLQQPSSVAVDADDNLYVSDPKLRLVLIYGPDGHFRRYLGVQRGEMTFGMPTALALDRDEGLLYVLDSEANELIVMSLDGSIVRRIGDFRNRAGMKFDSPTQVAALDGNIAVLDMNGTRVQLFDRRGVRRTEILLPVRPSETLSRQMGLALDGGGNIYMTDGHSEELRVYASDGTLVHVVRGASSAERSFSSPSGVWVDATGRLLVADTGHSRIQVFQIAMPPPAKMAATAPMNSLTAEPPIPTLISKSGN